VYTVVAGVQYGVRRALHLYASVVSVVLVVPGVPGVLGVAFLVFLSDGALYLTRLYVVLLLVSDDATPCALAQNGYLQ
jgi:hypothetical protein